MQSNTIMTTNSPWSVSQPYHKQFWAVKLDIAVSAKVPVKNYNSLGYKRWIYVNFSDVQSTISITTHPGATKLRMVLCKTNTAITNLLWHCLLWKWCELLLGAGWMLQQVLEKAFKITLKLNMNEWLVLLKLCYLKSFLLELNTKIINS